MTELAIAGPYYSPWHWRAGDMRYVSEMRPAWARIHQFNARSVSETQQASPQTRIMLRSWDIDDHNGDRKREMYKDPIGAAHLHHDMWRAKLKALTEQLQREERFFDTSKWAIGLANEPDSNYLPQIVRYTEEWFRLTEWPLGVGVSSVGTFPKPGESPNSWALFKPLERAIRDTNSIVIAHEYWQPEGPRCIWVDSEGKTRHDAYNLAWRHHAIPLDVPILIGEAGANGYLWNRHSNRDDSGWQAHAKLGLTAERFAEQVREYIEECDERVEGVLLYMMDYHSDQWRSFDTEPAHADLLRIAKPARPKVKSPFTKQPNTVHIPAVTIGKPQVMYVTATAGLNVRARPDTASDIVARLPHAQSVEVSVKRGDWWAVPGGWVHGAWLSETQPEAAKPVEPQPTQTGIIDPRTATAILQVESGGQGFGPGGRLLIRFENHLFNEHTGNRYANLFAVGNPKWTGHRWRRSESDAWVNLHAGRNLAEIQDGEWAAFEFAASLNRNAAMLSISMGAPQILGSNHRRIGYASAEAMFNAFGNRQYGMAAQMVGFTNFCLSSAELMQAIAERDFATVARLYNGGGQVEHYAALMQAAWDKLG